MVYINSNIFVQKEKNFNYYIPFFKKLKQLVSHIQQEAYLNKVILPFILYYIHI